jgi:hypothetical protein
MGLVVQSIQKQLRSGIERFMINVYSACHLRKSIANLGTMSIEMMLQYIHNAILPQMNVKERGDDNQLMLIMTDEECSQLLERYKLSCICLSTVYRWLKKLGVNYKPRKNLLPGWS